MREWPKHLPIDLRHRLEGVMGMRSFGPMEVYWVFKEWCEENGVEAPELDDEPSIPASDQTIGH